MFLFISYLNVWLCVQIHRLGTDRLSPFKPVNKQRQSIIIIVCTLSFSGPSSAAAKVVAEGHLQDYGLKAEARSTEEMAFLAQGKPCLSGFLLFQWEY